MSITAKELAALLGLSESAISLALNNKPGVSAQTRKRVLAAAEKNGYDFSRINPQTDQTPTGSIYFIIYRKNGAVVADTPFFTELSEGVDLECKRLHYFFNVQYLYEDDKIEETLKMLSRIGVKGLIVLGTEMKKEDVLPFLKSGIPFVLLDNYFEDLDIDSVLINNQKGAFSATDYLIRKRKKQPGYLHSSYSINNFEERADGFYKAIRKHGMSTSRSIVHLLTPSVDGAYSDMCELLSQDEPLADCYFADNDLIAAGAVRAWREAGYRIPQDIAVIGFDNMPICTYLEPALTTIHVPKAELGKLAVRQLHERMADLKSPPLKTEISTTLIKRRST